MKAIKQKNEAVEPTLPLSSIRAGEVFRFAHDSFEDALKSDLFFMRLDSPELKDAAKIVNLADGKMLVRDLIHRVITHDAVIKINQ